MAFKKIVNEKHTLCNLYPRGKHTHTHPDHSICFKIQNSVHWLLINLSGHLFPVTKTSASFHGWYILTIKLIITREKSHWQRRKSSLLINILHSLLKLRLLRIIGVRAEGRWLSLAWATYQDTENYWPWHEKLAGVIKWWADRNYRWDCEKWPNSTHSL